MPPLFRESTRALCVSLNEGFASLFTREVTAADAVNRHTFSRTGRRNPEGNQDYTRIL